MRSVTRASEMQRASANPHWTDLDNTALGGAYCAKGGRS
jgi:hypothetical protein